MLGVGEHQAEDVLRSESAARAVLTRRNFFAAGAALATGAAFSFPPPAFSLADWQRAHGLAGDGLRTWAAIALAVPFTGALYGLALKQRS